MSNTSFSSVCEMLDHRIDSTPDAVAMYGRRGSSWYQLNWRETGERIHRIACGLLSLGIEPEQRVSIQCETRPEWVLADMGILSAGAATTTIYPSSGAEDCVYILENSGSVAIFVENAEQLAKLQSVWGQLPALQHAILLDGGTSDDERVVTLSELEQQGAAWDAENEGAAAARKASVGPETLATIIYTSGTTGPPKGVMLTHDNWIFEGEAIDKLAILQPSDKQYLFLPLAHAFAKVMEIAFIRLGVPTVVDGDIESLVENLQATQPTMIGAVPRIFEKIYDKVVASAREAGGSKLKIFHWAIGVGTTVSHLRQQGLEPKGLLAFQHRLADKLVFSKLKARFGGKVRYFISGGAPLSQEIAEFFHAADILVLEGYGMTETSAASFVNRADAFKFGTVGLPVPGMEVDIAEDGEVLMRGRGVMKGYHNLPEATAETLIDGWLHTGDIGVVDAEGFLKITDRKKDIIVTAGGKNIAPQNVENAIKAKSVFVSQAVMHGDKRAYCVALLTLNEDAMGTWATSHGLTFNDSAELAALPQVHERIWTDVQAVNLTLASYESIKKIHILPADLSQDAGELTPTLKVKRRVVEAQYQNVLDGMYA